MQDLVLAMSRPESKHGREGGELRISTCGDYTVGGTGKEAEVLMSAVFTSIWQLCVCLIAY